MACTSIGTALGCSAPAPRETADLIVTGRVYTLAWEEPGLDGTSSPSAPRGAEGWKPDAEAIAVREGKILYVGASEEAARYRGEATRILDAGEATVIPGLIDSHTHVAGLGELESQVSLFGVKTEEEAVQRVVDAASNVPEGEWILARGWDDSDWASRYPTWDLLNEKFPRNPVVMQSLHGFAVWGNRKAFEAAGIDESTPAPSGGRILKDARGKLTGIVLDRAGRLLTDAIPEPTPERFKSYVKAGLERMARDGYVAVHEAGVDRNLMDAFFRSRPKGIFPSACTRCSPQGTAISAASGSEGARSRETTGC